MVSRVYDSVACISSRTGAYVWKKVGCKCRCFIVAFSCELFWVCGDVGLFDVVCDC